MVTLQGVERHALARKPTHSLGALIADAEMAMWLHGVALSYVRYHRREAVLLLRKLYSYKITGIQGENAESHFLFY